MAGRIRHALDRCSDISAGQRPPGERPWPDAAQLWSWAETVELLGYGPGASFFV
ncbi:hypothetical protein ACGF13_17020 [Kitasatospora sp. NPDC048286]|uniref:hypothetical protein n=1 Tax=unclassified Kitasatospora TaxID=2633591 RepID=UPI00371407D8